MALVIKDRVKETTTTSGTGSITVAGAVEGFQSFATALADGDTFFYAIEGGAEWETGLGTWDEVAGTVARTTVYESSNSGSLVSFSIGEKNIFITKPASRMSTVTVYASPSTMPTTNLSAGDMAWANSTSSLYISNGSGWYQVTTVNQTPTITGNSTNYNLATDGTATVVTLTGTDAEGFPLTWSSTTSGDTQVGTVTNVDNVFTITPSTNTSNGGTMTVTFSASDGINTATADSDFLLSFTSPNYQYVVLSMDADGGSIHENINSASIYIGGSFIAADSSITKYSTHSIYLNKTISSDGYIYSDTPNTSYTGQSFCVEFWRYETGQNVTTNSGMFQLGQGTQYKLLIYWNGSNLAAYTDNTSIMSNVVVNWTRPLGQWVHYAATWDGSTYRFFQDGSLTRSVSNSTSLTFGTGARLAINYYNGTTSALSRCYVDNVQLVFGIPKYTQAFTVPAGYQGQSYQLTAP